MTTAIHFGPFVHILNKGGLHSIVQSASFRGTVASNNMANDDPAVRAYVGSFEHQQRNKNWSSASMTVIEFLTFTPPRPGCSPGYAEWRGEQLIDGHLAVRILRVLNGRGEPVYFAGRDG